ncbi:MAG TPA: SDR family oxidoreductase [Nitrososphaerales archaeon]|nr:SDR family oxidoreductase [Nitrososphaerales archaeon]
MKGKVCIVTGTSAGIGKATSIGLAKLDATVVAVMRDSQKSSAALEEIKTKSGKADSVIHLAADLSSQKSIRDLVKEFTSRFDRLDVLLNNAGVSQFHRSLSPDGIEMTFAVNVLAPFLLTTLLTDKLKSSAPSRIVNVSSAASNNAEIDFDDLQGEKKYGSFRIYEQSKLCLNLITVEFSRRLEGTRVTANFLHPGVIRTELGTRDANLIFKAIAALVKLFMASPEKGSRTSIYLSTSPDVESVTGKYFANQKQVAANPISFDVATTKRLWEVCEKMTGVSISPQPAKVMS